MPTPLFDLTGRRALITGSSRGIGLAYAYAVAEHGAEVVLNSRSAEDVGKAVEKMRADGHKATGYAFDVADPSRRTSRGSKPRPGRSTSCSTMPASSAGRRWSISRSTPGGR